MLVNGSSKLVIIAVGTFVFGVLSSATVTYFTVRDRLEHLTTRQTLLEAQMAQFRRDRARIDRRLERVERDLYQFPGLEGRDPP